jgi:hypothetical protein
MMAGPSRHRDPDTELPQGGLSRYRNRLGLPRTAGEMTLQTSVSHNSNFSLQQGLVRLVGHREPR